MKIAVDAVGGDYFPKNPVEGAILATQENKDIEIFLVGPEELLQKELMKHEYDKDRIGIIHAPQVIGMDESPAKAVKMKRESSIVVGLALQKKEMCDAFVSAGNTGALLAASTFILGKLDRVIRPTIASLYPTLKGVRLLVDAGANLEVKPEMLKQFGLMGEVYAREILDIDDPTIGLLNVGEEAEKGTDILKEAYQMLKKYSNFKGNVEGRDILIGSVDVYVCDGLVGNITLKFGESIVPVFRKMIQSAIAKNELDEKQQNVVLKIIHDVMRPFDSEVVGGVPFLGVNGTSLVGHGSSSAIAVKNMIFNAALCVENKLNDKIVTSLSN